MFETDLSNNKILVFPFKKHFDILAKLLLIVFVEIFELTFLIERGSI